MRWCYFFAVKQAAEYEGKALVLEKILGTEVSHGIGSI